MKARALLTEGEGEGRSDPSFEKTNLHGVPFCPARSSSSQKALSEKGNDQAAPKD